MEGSTYIMLRFDLNSPLGFGIILALLGAMVGVVVNLLLPIHVSKPPIEPVALEANTFTASKVLDISPRPNQANEVQKTEQSVSVNLLKEFRLSATITGDKIRAAIVEYKGKGEYLMVGDVFNGYELESVATNEAVFLKDGKRYALYIFQEIPANVQDGTSSQKDAKGAKIVIPGREMFAQIKEKDGVYFVPRPLMREYLNLRTIFSQIRILPMVHNGKFAGFFVQSVNPGGIFRKLGLRSKDIIVSVNGKELQSSEDAFEYFNAIEHTSELKLGIKRGVEEKELVYEIF